MNVVAFGALPGREIWGLFSRVVVLLPGVTLERDQSWRGEVRLYYGEEGCSWGTGSWGKAGLGRRLGKSDEVEGRSRK